MSGVNKVILVGHLGKDPKFRYFIGSSSKVSMSSICKRQEILNFGCLLLAE